MMVMAKGFAQAITNSKNQTDELYKLSQGELGEGMSPQAFNVGYVGPEGPIIFDGNGDVSSG